MDGIGGSIGDAATKALAVVGTSLAWFPIVIPIVLSLAGLIVHGVLRIDYLMPAENWWAAFIGGALLLWAALRARARRALIGWGFAAMVALLIGGQALAIVTGLASGETEPGGWQWGLVLVSIAGYTVVVIEIGCAGLLLVRDLFRLLIGNCRL
jgi:hypothetical protein